MKNKGKTLLTLFLITWVVFAFVIFVENAYRFIGKSFFESNEFGSTIEDFKTGLNEYVLNDFDAEKAKKNVKVTQSEIEYYRNYYGTLEDQISNIQDQYVDRIEEAENKKLKEILVKERDAKIDDITKNFEDDQYVEEKIKKAKFAMIDEYSKMHANRRDEILNESKYFAYELKNVKTGEVYSFGNPQDNVYEEIYGGSRGYYTVQNDTVIRMDDINSNSVSEAFLINELRIESDSSQYEGIISVPKSMLKNASFKYQYESFKNDKITFTIIWISGLIAFILFLTVAKPSKEMFVKFNNLKDLYLKWPLDVKIVLMIICGMFIYFIVNTIGVSFYNSSWFETIILFLMLFSLITLTIYALVWTWETINSEGKFIDEVKRSFIYQTGIGLVDIFLYRSIAGLLIISLLGILFFGIGMGFVFGYSANDSFLPFFLAFLSFPVVLIFLKQMGYLNRIMKHTEKMAEGKATSELNVKGKFPFANHAANLNKVREGVQKSMSEQAKSERLKTELITNVSHDLRTPLTSIITYTDLLKSDDLTDEERKHYVDVIDKKSARLKTLIEDLFEVSKMTSGNIELNKARVDLAQMLQQTVGEHEEAFKNNQLELRVSISEQPIFANVDGQKWWRVFDNLLVNALKYSLPNTRVYVSLTKTGQETTFTIKNVSSYELNENAEELVERFKRADASRNTEGSGLGLAIVQSIVNLHDGKMNIEVDGDLFKVTVSINAE